MMYIIEAFDQIKKVGKGSAGVQKISSVNKTKKRQGST